MCSVKLIDSHRGDKQRRGDDNRGGKPLEKGGDRAHDGEGGAEDNQQEAAFAENIFFPISIFFHDSYLVGYIDIRQNAQLYYIYMIDRKKK